MKTLLAVLPLALSAQVLAQGAEQTAPTLPAESPRRTVIEFEDEALDLEPTELRRGCVPRWSPVVRVRENFDDKVMQSADEM
ncbi:hypothetical protein D187_006771 [Cystobacter fuscus DSM 2262]|uniref:Uncharacterized protein n=1 Tax=Cystobacter fuscus (strain ATCC 25194 / DSM 2262 / NBRC 100088 / M29) TaxID=1242864 RepID=S9P456_CYSF2|nr:hypothetical protein [Cystobacter fuscus]EPX57017.1 hypothetical protein D187_006771 [Cystobacter fuscus DSM 2262]